MSRTSWALVLAAVAGTGCKSAAPSARPVPRLVVQAHARETHAAAFSPDGSLIASAGGGESPGHDQISLWSAATGQRRRSFTGPGGRVTCLAFSTDGTLLAVGWAEGRISLFETESGKERISFVGRAGRIYCLCFSFDGTVLSSVAYAEGDRGAEITRWDVKRGVPRDTLTPTSAPPFAMSSEGAFVAWPGDGPPAGITLLNLETHAQKLLSKVDVRREDALVFSPDGKWLAAVHQADWNPFPNRCPYLYLISAQTGRIRLRTPRPFGCRLGLAISHDAQLLARGADDRTEIWDVATLEMKASMDDLPSDWGGELLLFSPDDHTLLSTDGGGSVALWDVPQLFEVRSEAPLGVGSQ